MKTYSIAIDIGGSKISAILLNDKSEPLARYNGDGANSTNRDSNSVKKNISQCIDALISNVAIHSITNIYGWMMHSADTVLETLEKHGQHPTCHILNEGVMGAFSCGITGDAVVGLSGTGSGAFFVSQGKLLDWIGGWGSLLGDDGSGFSLGREYLRSLIYNEEHGIDDSGISYLRDLYHCNTFREAIFHIYATPTPAATIASFSKKVCLDAENRNTTAINQISEAGKQLSEQILQIYKRNNLHNVPLCLMGGLIQSSTIMQKSLADALCSSGLNTDILLPILSPVEGAVIYSEWEKNGSLTRARYTELLHLLKS